MHTSPARLRAAPIFRHWIIVSQDTPDLAWSGSRWVPHIFGLAAEGVEIASFNTESEARTYAGQHGMNLEVKKSAS